MHKPQQVFIYLLAVVLVVSLSSLSLSGAVAQTSDFSVALSNTSISIPQGSSATLNLYVTSLGDFAYTVSLSFSGPTGVTAVFNGNGPSQVATAAGGTSSSTVTLYVDPSANTGTVPVFVTAASPTGLSHSAMLWLTVTPAGTALSTPNPDFLAQSSPAVVTLTPDVSKSTTIVLSSVNGFSSFVNLVATWTGVAPTGVTVSLPSPVAVPASGSASSALTLTADGSPSTGTYTLLVTAANGVVSHSTDITVVIAGTPSVFAPVAVPDFSISSAVTNPSPAEVTLKPDMSQSVAILLSSLDGFSSTVSLSAAWSGVAPNDVTVNLPSSFAIPASGSASSTVTLTSDSSPSTGTYSLVVTASNGAIAHSTQIPVIIEGEGTVAVLAPVTPSPAMIPDFSVTPTSDTVSTIPGLDAGTSVTVNSLGSFSSPVSFSVSWVGSAPTGISVNIPQTVTPPPGGEASSPIEFTTTAIASTGTFMAQVTATSGSVSHSTDITLQVTSPGPFVVVPSFGGPMN